MKYLLLLAMIVAFCTSNGQTPTVKDGADKNSVLDENQEDINYSYNIIQTVNNTWCYDIFKENKHLIHQTSIPGLPGNEGFRKKSDAERVAQLVIEKLKQGEMPPSVTIDELKKMKVL